MPSLMALPLSRFAAAAARAVGGALDVDPSSLAVGTPPPGKAGDFAVGCFPAAKLLGEPPAKLAARVVERFSPTPELAAATAAGPFVNFHADRPALYRHLFRAALGGEELIPSGVGAGKTICIDYSSPNISKHLAYHHIRTTVIGHALVKLNRALGYHVVGINHLGDWGTTHGMVLAGLHRWPSDGPLTIERLNELYVKFRTEMEADPTLEDAGRAWFKKLEDGDAEARRLWETFRDVSWAECQKAYQVLGIQFEEVRGESEYVNDIPAVLRLLEDRRLTQVSEGALVVPLGDDMPPLLLRKQDGASLYATRDLAAAIYRWERHHFERSLYVVDRGQALHFQQLFRTLALAGMEWASRCIHVPFGLIRIGGKKTGTRTGNVVLLQEFLAEAQSRARQRVAEANPAMAPELIDETARMVGVGAVVFANLVSHRDKDVDFEWEDVLSLEGDSGPYVQYAHARCCRALEKAGQLAPAADADAALLTHADEWRLARQLSDFPDVVARAAEGAEPHHVCRYLLDVGATFSRWYTAGNQDPRQRFLVGDVPTSTARLTLVATTREVLRRGLSLLGIEAPQAM
jgi:arginyl-tRNA synthetase